MYPLTQAITVRSLHFHSTGRPTDLDHFFSDVRKRWQERPGRARERIWILRGTIVSILGSDGS